MMVRLAQLQLSDHWLVGTKRLLSPNYDDRPLPGDISLLLIHCISLPPGEFGANYVSRLFCNQLNTHSHPTFASLENRRVSCHLLIDREGTITQYVPFNARAWHAGQSNFRGRSHCNDFSIGIELEGDEQTPYTEMQYSALAAVATLLMKEYPKIKADCLAGHEEVAPSRKTDPGASFDWPRLRQKIQSLA